MSTEQVHPEPTDQLRGSGILQADSLMDYLALITDETEKLPKSRFERHIELILGAEPNPEAEAPQ